MATKTKARKPKESAEMLKLAAELGVSPSQLRMDGKIAEVLPRLRPYFTDEQIEKLTKTQLISFLKCPEEDYYALYEQYTQVKKWAKVRNNELKEQARTVALVSIMQLGHFAHAVESTGVDCTEVWERLDILQEVLKFSKTIKASDVVKYSNYGEECDD